MTTENGFAVPLVLVFLVALALLGGTATLLTTGDLRVAGLHASSHRAFASAASALDHGLVAYTDGGPGATWPLVGTIDGFGYRVRLVRDSADLGGGQGPVSLDELGPGSAHNTDGRGDPVHVLTAVASRGPIRSMQRRWLTQRAVPRLPGALTIHAGGATEWVGGGRVSGTNVDPSGAAVDPGSRDTAPFCGRNRPAIHVARAGAPAPVISMSLDGNAAYAGASPPFTTQARDLEWTRPEDVIGARTGSLDAHRTSGFLHGMSPPASLSGVTWITDEAGGSTSCLTSAGCAHLEGDGILIVHNPRYDPRQHDPTDPRYDPVIAADPTYGPARLRDVSGGLFRGIVIVDELPRSTSGPLRIRGAMIELSRRAAAARFDWPAGTDIEYSCRAIFDAAQLADLRPRVLAWRG